MSRLTAEPAPEFLRRPVKPLSQLIADLLTGIRALCTGPFGDGRPVSWFLECYPQKKKKKSASGQWKITFFIAPWYLHVTEPPFPNTIALSCEGWQMGRNKMPNLQGGFFSYLARCDRSSPGWLTPPPVHSPCLGGCSNSCRWNAARKSSCRWEDSNLSYPHSPAQKFGEAKAMLTQGCLCYLQTQSSPAG